MPESVRVFLCGDVMTGRGIDQILPHSCPPVLHERYVRDAREYVRLAERAHGRIPHPVDFGYVWGDALAALDRCQPALRLINLETAVTTSDVHDKGKGIHYRMHPGNLPCLTAAGVQVCSLANNHVLDWGFQGLEETMHALRDAGIQPVGAGGDAAQAGHPAVKELNRKRRISVFSRGVPSTLDLQRKMSRTERFPGLNPPFADHLVTACNLFLWWMSRFSTPPRRIRKLSYYGNGIVGVV